MGCEFMVRGRLKKRRGLRASKKFLTFAPFTVFLIGFALLFRFWTVAPLVRYNDCEYKYFWLRNWSDGYSVLQLTLMIIFLMVVVVLLKIFFSKVKSWSETCVQLAMVLLFVAGANSLYINLFPYSTLAGEISEKQRATFKSSDMFLKIISDQEMSGSAVYPAGVKEALAPYHEEIEFAAWPEDGYYLVVRDDLSVEKLQAVGRSGTETLIQGNYPDYGEIEGLRACVARKQEFISKADQLSDDRKIIWIEEVGYLDSPKLSYSQRQSGYYYIYPTRLIKKPTQISLHR